MDDYIRKYAEDFGPWRVMALIAQTRYDRMIHNALKREKTATAEDVVSWDELMELKDKAVKGYKGPGC